MTETENTPQPGHADAVDGRELEDHGAIVRFHEKLADIELGRSANR